MFVHYPKKDLLEEELIDALLNRLTLAAPD